MSVFGWFRRLVSGGGNESVARSANRRNGGESRQAKPGPQSPQRVSYNCDLCGVASRLRAVVYDHFKAAHPDVIDRNGHIRENKDDDSTNRASQ
jgi:hypothetical protein